MADIYEGKVFGIFAPLKVKETPRHIDVVGGTFRLRVSKRTGQIVSARALGTEFIARGSALPNPYIALFPADEPGATPLGGTERPRYGHEISAGIHPRLWDGGLTGGCRYDVRTAEACEVLFCEPDRVVIRARGRYGETPVGRMGNSERMTEPRPRWPWYSRARCPCYERMGSHLSSTVRFRKCHSHKQL
jgi:hypothetical protein